MFSKSLYSFPIAATISLVLWKPQIYYFTVLEAKLQNGSEVQLAESRPYFLWRLWGDPISLPSPASFGWWPLPPPPQHISAPTVISSQTLTPSPLSHKEPWGDIGSNWIIQYTLPICKVPLDMKGSIFTESRDYEVDIFRGDIFLSLDSLIQSCLHVSFLGGRVLRGWSSGPKKALPLSLGCLLLSQKHSSPHTDHSQVYKSSGLGQLWHLLPWSSAFSLLLEFWANTQLHDLSQAWPNPKNLSGTMTQSPLSMLVSIWVTWTLSSWET